MPKKRSTLYYQNLTATTKSKKMAKKAFGGRDITPGTKDKGSGSDSDMVRYYGGTGDPKPKASREQEMTARIQAMYSTKRPRR